jgi:hypothetical protein
LPREGTLKRKPDTNINDQYEGLVMCDTVIALIPLYPAVEMAEQWCRSSVARQHVTEMRKHAAQHQIWDITRGQWVA